MTNFDETKKQFILPEGVVYLDGNSLGPMPKNVSDKLGNVLNDEWSKMLINGWNDAEWMFQPEYLGNKIARIIGAEENSVVVGETLSVRVYQALGSAIRDTKKRKIILTDSGNFPSDLNYFDEKNVLMRCQRNCPPKKRVNLTDLEFFSRC